MLNAMQYTRDLEESGFTKDQANMLLKFQMEVMESKFATKQDIKISELALRSDMKEMESNIRGDMKEMESNIRGDMKEMESGIRGDMKAMESGIRSDMKEMESGIRGDMKEQFSFLNHKIESTADKLTIRLTRNMVVLVSVMSGIIVMGQKFL